MGRQHVHGAPLRPQHAGDLAVETLEVRDVLEGRGGEDDVEAPIRKRDVLSVVLADRELARLAIARGREVDGGDVEARRRQDRRLLAGAAADLQEIAGKPPR